MSAESPTEAEREVVDAFQQAGMVDDAAHALEQGAWSAFGHKDDNTTPLLVAAQEGREDVVRDLLAAGCERDAVTSDGASALVLAAQEGHEGKAITAPQSAFICLSRSRGMR
jgi:hypothetical protein